MEKLNLKKPGHEYHLFHTLGWSLHLTNITLSFDVKSEKICSGKTGIKGDLERGNCPPNHSIKATAMWEPNNHFRNFDDGRSYARTVNFRKRYFNEALADNKTSRGHLHNRDRFNSRFQDHLFDE